MTQLDYIQLDTAFFDKPKIKGLGYRHGHEAILFLIRLLCAMGRSARATINQDAWGAIGCEAGFDAARASEIVGYCLEHEIISGTKEWITNSRIVEDQAALERKRALGRGRVAALRQRQKDGSNGVHTCQQPSIDHGNTAVQTEPETAPPITDPATEDPVVLLAMKKLEQPQEQGWTKDNRFILAGRRPMKDYPLVWLQPRELADIILKLESSDIPTESYKDLFQKAQARLSTYAAQGRNQSQVSVYNWLTGFLFDELLEKTIKETRLTNVLNNGGQRNGINR